MCELVAVGHTAIPGGHTGWCMVAVGHTAFPVSHTGWCVVAVAVPSRSYLVVCGELVAVNHTAVPVGHTRWYVGWWQLVRQQSE